MEGNDEFSIGNGDSAYGGTGDDIFELGVRFSGQPDGLIDGGGGTDLVRAGFGAQVNLSENTVSGAGRVNAYIENVENVEVHAWRAYSTSAIGDGANNHFFVTARFDDGSVGVFFDGRAGNDLLEGSAGQDRLLGGLGNDALHGFLGSDELRGGGGWDTLDGGAGNDLLNGGNGNDRASYLSAWAGVTVSLALEGAQNTERAGWDTLESIEDLTGSTFADTLTGSDGDNQIFGDAGSDDLFGGFGNDLLLGQDGDDVIEGQAGWDTLRGDDGNDTLIGGNGGDVLLGKDGIDMLSGNSGFDRIYGGSGGDIISGGADRDLLFGEGGDDIVHGDGGDDLVQGNNGDDGLDGGDGNDVVNGGAGNDTMTGGDGNDILIGNWGVDTMTGGAGADTFLFKAGHTGSYAHLADTILDFSQADGDIIDLSQIDAIAGGGDDAFAFIGDAAFSGTAGELRYTATEDGLMVEGDTDGDGVADLFIAVDGLADLTAADFVL
nr:calcium-binding protein [Qipengyuania vulgaris]